MADINAFATDLLIDFTDAMHKEMRRVLECEYGEDWIAKGVRRHFLPDHFSRVEAMISNPMRAVLIDKDRDEIHGLEHFWNIINGNWRIFQRFFGDRKRTEVYLGEISELRHNLAHRRRRHILLKSDLVRIAGDCAKCLSALESVQAERFVEVVDSLTSGGTTWGEALPGSLPPSDELYTEFIGRPKELSELSTWLESERPQIVVWGYGGAGKSALAYRFARDIRDSSSENLQAVCWVSAKVSEFVEGTTRGKTADFGDKQGFIRAVWCALYDTEHGHSELDDTALVEELKSLPILLVVDDFDTVLEDEDLSEFLLHDLRETKARVIYTSRHVVQGMRRVEVGPFSDVELNRFVRQRCAEYGADAVKCVRRLGGIRNVTSGYPLFVDDLIHHAAIIGVDRAMEDWSKNRGDAAREYALRRQVEHLGRGCDDVLIALSAINRPLSVEDIARVAGLTNHDAESGVRELLRWRMVNRTTDDSSDPAYRMNLNSSRLVQQTYRKDKRLKTSTEAVKALVGETNS